MTADDLPVEEADNPTAHTVRSWLGLLVVILFVIQVSASGWAYAEWYHTRTGNVHDMQVLWHRFAVAMGNSMVAMITLAGGTGLILNARWAWRTVATAAVLQILVTVATQLWEGLMPVPEGYPPERGLMGALIGIVAWNIIPVAVLTLSVAGRPRAARS